MKFEFELDDVDAENLYSVLNTNRMRAYVRLLDARDEPRATVQCLIDQYRYSEELMNTVFGGEVINMDLTHFDNRP